MQVKQGFKASAPRCLALIVLAFALGGCGGNDAGTSSTSPAVAASVATRISAGITSTSSDFPGAFVEQALTTPVDGASQYLVHLPKGYQDERSGQQEMRRKLWPLVIYLHGSTADGSQKTMDQLRGDGINYYIDHGGQDFPAIVVSPLSTIFGHDEAFVDAVIKDAQAKYPVDPSRISLSGFSMGGFGAYAVALAFPHRFSAVMPAGGGFMSDWFFNPQPISEYGSGFKHLDDTPFHVYHGVADQNVPVAIADNAVSALRNAEVKVDYTRVPGVDHLGITNYVFSADSLNWLISQRSDEMDEARPNHIERAKELTGRYEFVDAAGATQVWQLSVDAQGRLTFASETTPGYTMAFYSIGDDRYVLNSQYYRMIRNPDGRMGCMYWIGTFWGYPIYTDPAHAATCGYGPQN